MPVIMPALEREIGSQFTEFLRLHPDTPQIPPEDQPPCLICLESHRIIPAQGTYIHSRPDIPFGWWFRLPESTLLQALSGTDSTPQDIHKAMTQFKEIENLWCDLGEDDVLKMHSLVPALVDQPISPHSKYNSTNAPDAYYFTIRQGVLGQMFKAAKQYLRLNEPALKSSELKQAPMDDYLDRTVLGLSVGKETPWEPVALFRYWSSDYTPNASNKVASKEKFSEVVRRGLKPRLKRWTKRTGYHLDVVSNGRKGKKGAATLARFKVVKIDAVVTERTNVKQFMLESQAELEFTSEVGLAQPRPPKKAAQNRKSVRRTFQSFKDNGEIAPLVQEKTGLSRREVIDLTDRYALEKAVNLRPTTAKMWAQYVYRWNLKLEESSPDGQVLSKQNNVVDLYTPPTPEVVSAIRSLTKKWNIDPDRFDELLQHYQPSAIEENRGRHVSEHVYVAGAVKYINVCMNPSPRNKKT